jgi:hypothetical protein
VNGSLGRAGWAVHLTRDGWLCVHQVISFAPLLPANFYKRVFILLKNQVPTHCWLCLSVWTTAGPE